MNHPKAHFVLVAAMLFAATGCEAETNVSQQENTQMAASDTSKGQTGLPHSQGRVFDTLDEYLAHLKKMGMQDRPFYEEVTPGRYRLNTGRGGRGRPVQHFSREELKQKYGFDR